MYFITSLLNKDDLFRMFDKVTVQEGSDLEDEYVVTLSINGIVVLLLVSPERGNSIRIEGDDYLSMGKLNEILIEICNFYNKNFFN
jgi:hypothetical protein